VVNILGLSGYAFHTRWCHFDGNPTGCPDSVSLEQGFLVQAFSEHSGWKLQILFGQGWDRPEWQRAVPAIIASIDAGRPVVIEDKYIDAAVLYGCVNQKEVEMLASALDPDDGLWREFNQVRTAQVSRSVESTRWEDARSMERAEVWTPEIQQRERQIIEQALRLEHSATEYLEQARDQISL
jgi:hypothetical protein